MFEREPVGHARAHFGRVEHQPLVARLRHAERRFRALAQRFGVLAVVGKHRHAGIRGERNGLTIVRDRLRDLVQHRLDEVRHRALACAAERRDRELAAGQASGERVLRRRTRDTPGDFAQDLVARGTAQ